MPRSTAGRTGRLRARSRALLVAFVAVLAGCAGGGGDGARSPGVDGGPTASSPAASPSRLDWDRCGAVECATVAVPLDHDEPDGPALDLALARRPASGERLGALLVNPGGPGAPALDLAKRATEFFPESLTDRFDVVAWDPRGVGESAGIDCTDDLDALWAADRSPDDEREAAAVVEVATDLGRACAGAAGDRLAHVSTADTVRDLELIREALGEEQISYLGFSYGTFLGARYAEAHPDRVRAMVLDGAVDPSLGPEETARAQAAGFETSFATFLADCAADTGCAFHSGGDPGAAYDRLAARIDAEPIDGVVDGETRRLGPGELDLGVTTALYSGRRAWRPLAEALAAAERGDGAALLRFADTYTGREPGGGYADDLEAFFAVSCLDGPPIGDPDAVLRAGEAIGRESPRFGEATALLGMECATWPVPATGRTGPVVAAGAPPILVLGTTRDPATPLRWAESLAGQLEAGVLAVLDGETHTAFGQGSECIDQIVVRALVEEVLPPDGTRC